VPGARRNRVPGRGGRRLTAGPVFELDADLTAEQRATLLKLTERYCVVYQTLRAPPPVTVELRTLARA